MKKCSICSQKVDVYTTAHRKEPFADGRNYDCVCFTCFFVPKISEQKYAQDGSVSEEMTLPYSCESLCDPKDLYGSGAADTLKQAKISVEEVSKLCVRAKGQKIPKKRPEASWSVA